MRRTLKNCRFSRIPSLIGTCQDDLPGIAAAVNEAQQRLLAEFGETGPFGCWEKVLFSASPAAPYLTLPAQYARAINLAVCHIPVRLYNEFYSVLPGGPGIPCAGSNLADWCGQIQGFDAGMVPTMVDLPVTSTTPAFTLRLYPTDPADVASGKRILIKCLDANGQQVWTQDANNQVNGVYLQVSTPFTDSAFTVSKIQAVNKDETLGSFILKAVDPVTGSETTLSTYGPRETMPTYRRYQITKMPCGCCPTCAPGTPAATTVYITALCKLEFIPVEIDTDYLIVPNIPALTEECQSMRYAEMDKPEAMQKAEYHHHRAIQQLKNEMNHYMGEQVPSITIDRWEGQSLQALNIGSMR
jgi:hypothetical protein